MHGDSRPRRSVKSSSCRTPTAHFNGEEATTVTKRLLASAGIFVGVVVLGFIVDLVQTRASITKDSEGFPSPSLKDQVEAGTSLSGEIIMYSIFAAVILAAVFLYRTRRRA